MAGSEVKVYCGRSKAFALQWRQGGASGPPINATGAVFSVLRTTLPKAPDINIVDEALGKYELVFTEDCTKGLSPGGSTRSVTIGLTFAGDPSHSPDPVTLQVIIA